MKKNFFVMIALLFIISCDDDSNKQYEDPYFNSSKTLNIRGSYNDKGLWNLWKLSDVKFYNSTAAIENNPTSADIVWSEDSRQICPLNHDTAMITQIENDSATDYYKKIFINEEQYQDDGSTYYYNYTYNFVTGTRDSEGFYQNNYYDKNKLIQTSYYQHSDADDTTAHWQKEIATFEKIPSFNFTVMHIRENKSGISCLVWESRCEEKSLMNFSNNRTIKYKPDTGK